VKLCSVPYCCRWIPKEALPLWTELVYAPGDISLSISVIFLRGSEIYTFIQVPGQKTWQVWILDALWFHAVFQLVYGTRYVYCRCYVAFNLSCELLNSFEDDTTNQWFVKLIIYNYQLSVGSGNITRLKRNCRVSRVITYYTLLIQ
jgi:hypothetical protein